MSSIKLSASDFRAIKRMEWQPKGVTLLAGPNGAGKTTALHAFKFMRLLFERGHEDAFEALDGDHFRRHFAPKETPVVFEVEVEDIRWRVRLPMSDTGITGRYAEELYRHGTLILKSDLFDDGWYLGNKRMPPDPADRRCHARFLWDKREDGWMVHLDRALSGIRIYDAYWLNQVQRPDGSDPRAHFLHYSGKNLWSVLANWKNAPIQYRGQFDWVLSKARAAFPGVLSTIEFERGQTYLYPEGATDPSDGLPPKRAADGLLTGLLHLTAVAGANNGSIVAIDEMENQLHPHAIRTILAAMRELADERDLTIILTTHSPVVMNEFNDYKEDFFVIDSNSSDPQPQALLKAYDENWLSHFSLGDLYEREGVARQSGEK